MRRITLVFALLALALPTFSQQQQPFQEEIDVNAVLLDVIVTDAKGHHILGLGKDDFIVTENGVEQTIDSVDYFTNRRLLDAREEQAAFRVERVREDRYFIFFFDKPTDPAFARDQLTLAREAVRDFVRNDMKPSDLVAIVGHDMRLKIYSDFTGNKPQLERALDEATRFGRGITRPPAGEGPSILRNINTKDLINRTGTVYQGIDLLADSVRNIRARKNLVLFSPGIADRDESVFAGEMLSNRSRYLDPMLESLNAANVAVYGVQLQRDVSPAAVFHQRLSEMAESTGGRYFQINVSFKPAIEQIENVNSGYYLITYRSKQPRGKSGFQKVDVKLRNPEFKVVTRSGYGLGG
ncbi:MAG TPA: VWA domain-containing protein [Thermoanaerobaculia bacterium]|nr:VWA domain-containing protein [Thermoanaerobaculia bacterium]